MVYFKMKQIIRYFIKSDHLTNNLNIKIVFMKYT